MAEVIETLRQEKKLAGYLSEGKKRVLIIFWHGLGDLVMFLNPLHRLRLLFPDIVIDVALAKGLGLEEILPNALMVTADDMKTLDKLDYDIVAKVHFPMSEAQTEFTKGEWCCLRELGIPPTNGHCKGVKGVNRLVAVHFNITCLPEAANPSQEIAQAIWQDILDAGHIPIESHFEHVFHNPVNKKFDFVDCTVRKAQARVSSLIGLIQNCAAFVGVVSGNFHVALATLPSSRIFFLEKHFKLECFSHLPIARASIKEGEYKGEVKKWLQDMDT